MSSFVKIIECPRDAMQGMKDFIATDVKADYINALLKVGFQTIDFGSFVSEKAIPQMKDTVEVLSKLDTNQKTSLLAIVANLRGAEEAAHHDKITYLGYPFSISETFQLRNTHSTIAQSTEVVDRILEICHEKNKELVIYISMAFGNPYGDPWNSDVAMNWVDKIHKKGVNIISLADTVGVAKPDDVAYLFEKIIPEFKNVELGAHLHCRPDNWRDKVDAAFSNGCKRFDSAMKGFGGCPMANDSLVGNLATENLVSYLMEKGIESSLDMKAFKEALSKAGTVFPA